VNGIFLMSIKIYKALLTLFDEYNQSGQDHLVDLWTRVKNCQENGWKLESGKFLLNMVFAKEREKINCVFNMPIFMQFQGRI
jgi:hypothetical protein